MKILRVAATSLLLALVTLAAAFSPIATQTSTALAASASLQNGADVSWLPEIEQGGSKFYDSKGKRTDPLVLMKKAGLTTARVRLWVSPPSEHSSLTETLALAKRIKKAGLKLVLDLHYSDWWADPSHQAKPAAWADLGQTELVAKVAGYTTSILNRFAKQRTPPTWVQIGNEIANGLLWPNGQLDQWTDAKFSAMTELVNAGIAAARASIAKPRVMIHLETGGDPEKTRGWLRHAFDNGLIRPDAIGLSYYSQWAGPLSNLEQSLAVVVDEFDLRVAVAETAYPNTRNSVSSQVLDPQASALSGFSISAKGQAAYATRVAKLLRATAGSSAIGIWWWEGISPNTSRLSSAFGPSAISGSSLVSGTGRPNAAMLALGRAKS